MKSSYFIVLTFRVELEECPRDEQLVLSHVVVDVGGSDDRRCCR